MRPPLAGDAVAPLPRKSSGTQGSAGSQAFAGQGTETTYFIADEKAMEATGLEPSEPRPPTGMHATTFGVQSLSDTVEEASLVHEVDRGPQEGDSDDARAKQRLQSSPKSITSQLRSIRTSELQTSLAQPESPPQPSLQSGQWSRSPSLQLLTPSLPLSPAPEPSLPSSPRSVSSRWLRPEDSGSTVDDSASQAVVSSDEDEAEMPAENQHSAPQLIMPSIKMPSRRPFTEHGKAMGRFKVLLAGGSATGKTSLIKSIVQTLEDIVHVDPLPTGPQRSRTGELEKPGRQTSSREHSGTQEITEVSASTKPYAAWWSELDESRILKRRKSLADSVLERNLCFVDTPGYAKDGSASDSIDKIVGYVEGQFQRTASMDDMTDGDITNLLGGNGGSQVDAVFLLLSHKLRSADAELIRRLSPLTNVIPLISKSDLLSREKTAVLRANILQGLRVEDLQLFLFGRSIEEVARSDGPVPPYAISSATGNDADTMDASLLMSADYVQPLMPSELNTFVDLVFQNDSIAWLRHSAARKFVNWRNRAYTQNRLPEASHQAPMPPSSVFAGSRGSLSNSASTSSPSARGTLSAASSNVLVPPVGATSSYALARVADHRQREERLAQVRLAKWASDLQRSLQNERERYEVLARGERAVWLTERLGECVADGTIVPVAPDSALTMARRPPGSSPEAFRPNLKPLAEAKRWTVQDPRDPLGLLHYNDELRRQGWLALQVVGGLGVIGSLAVWIARNWNTLSGDLASWRWNC